MIFTASFLLLASTTSESQTDTVYLTNLAPLLRAVTAAVTYLQLRQNNTACLAPGTRFIDEDRTRIRDLSCERAGHHLQPGQSSCPEQ